MARLRGEITAVTGLHLGSGKTFDMSRSDAPILRDPRGHAYVPGSSLRGVLRAGLEALLRAVDRRDLGLWACDPFGAPCVSDDLAGIADGLARVEHVEARGCAACRVFGASGFASRVWIGDLRSLTDSITQVRDGVGIDRDLRTARDKIKFDYELLAPGARFSLDIRTRNLAPWEHGLIAVALDLVHDGQLRLGGLGARGLGQVAVRIEEVVEAEAAQLLLRQSTRTSISPGAPRESLATWIEALEHRCHGGR